MRRALEFEPLRTRWMSSSCAFLNDSVISTMRLKSFDVRAGLSSSITRCAAANPSFVSALTGVRILKDGRQIANVHALVDLFFANPIDEQVLTARRVEDPIAKLRLLEQLFEVAELPAARRPGILWQELVLHDVERANQLIHLRFRHSKPLRDFVLCQGELFMKPVYMSGLLEWRPCVLAGDVHFAEQNRDISRTDVRRQHASGNVPPRRDQTAASDGAFDKRLSDNCLRRRFRPAER